MNPNTFVPPGATGAPLRSKPSGDARTSLTDRFNNPETIDKKINKMNMTAD